MSKEHALGPRSQQLLNSAMSGDIDVSLSTLAKVRPDSLRKWDSQKLERNALTALVVYWSFLRSWKNRESRQPFGFIDHSEPIFTDQSLEDKDRLFRCVTELTGSMSKTLKSDLNLEIGDDTNNEREGYKQGVVNLLKAHVTPFWRGHQRVIPDPKNLSNFVAGGIETAVDVLDALSKVGFETFYKENERVPNREEFSQLVRGTYKIASFIASHHVNDLSRILGYLSKNVRNLKLFNPNHFDLIDNKLIINKDAREFLTSNMRDSLQDSITTGCPALVGVRYLRTNPEERPGFTNVIHGITNWYADSVLPVKVSRL